MLERDPLSRRARCARVGEGSLNAEGCLGGDATGDLYRSIYVLASSNNLLHKADPPGFLGTELLRRQQEPHRVAPPEAGGRTEGCTAVGQDAAPDLELAESHVIRSHDDVAGQGKLDR